MSKIKLNVELGENRNYDNIPTSPGEGYFPEFSFTEDEPCDLPDKGTLTIEYRLVRHSEDTKNEDRPKYSYTVEVRKLVSAEAESDEAPTKKYDEASDALDKLAEEKSKESEY